MPYTSCIPVSSITKHSSLSRNQIAAFLTDLNKSKVYPTTVTKMARVLGFDQNMPIPLEQVQRIYLLGCAKEILDGNNSYEICGNLLNLAVGNSQQWLAEAWIFVESHGATKAEQFRQELLAFHLSVQKSN